MQCPEKTHKFRQWGDLLFFRRENRKSFKLQCKPAIRLKRPGDLRHPISHTKREWKNHFSTEASNAEITITSYSIEISWSKSDKNENKQR